MENKRKWGLVILALLVIAVLGWGILNLLPAKPVNAGEIAITALQQNQYGVAQDSAFKITFENPVDQKMVKENLRIEPTVTYQLKKEAGGKTYRIIPGQQLAANTVYKFAFDPSGKKQESLSWAFQTTGSFRLLSTLPRTETVGVPLNTGIEFTFTHDSFEVNTASKLIQITPKVEGRFEKHKKTLVFIPKSLQPATLYTVTLKKGLNGPDDKEAIADDYIFRFETAAQNVSDEKFVFYLESQVSEFNTGQVPTFPVSFASGAGVPRPNIGLYRFPNAESYGTAMKKLSELPFWSTNSQEQFRQDLKKLIRVAGYETEFNQASQYRSFLVLPEKVAAGYYLIEVKAGDQVRQAIFQVSDLAAYRAQSQQQTMFWVNDITTQKPATGVQAWVNNKKLATADAEGVVLIDSQTTTNSASFALLKAGAKELLVPLNQELNPGSQDAITRQSYWKYLYLDRELYLPGDTVHYWGVLTPRNQTKTPANELTLELWGGDYYYSEERTAEPLFSQKIKMDANTFSGQCQLPVLKPGYYYLEVKLGKVALTSRGFSVATYQKPAYQLNVSPDKKAIFAGEKVNFLIKSTFFEGTPVPGLSLNYYANNKEGKLITNAQGEATVSYTGRYDADNFAASDYQYFNVNTSTPESGDIGDYNGVIVFPGSVMVRAEAKTNGDRFNLTARLNQVDLSSVDAGGYVSEENYLKAPIAGGKIKAKLFKEVWIRTKSGETYDYINKKVLPIYDYRFHTELIDSFELVTDQQGIANYSGRIDKGYSYYLELTSADTAGRDGRARVYVGEFYDDFYSYNYYFLKDTQGKPYLPGDKASLEMMKNNRRLDPQGKSILFFRGQTSIEAYQVTNVPHYEFAFKDADIPNTNVFGVFFDGESYQETGSYALAFDRQSQELKVAVQADKKEYHPGDTVKLSVLVQDKEKQPIKDARLNLNLVDEALYRLMDQRVDILGSLYGEYLTPILNTWKSHYHPQLRGGAEQGGEGGGDRRDFRDTVLFKDLITDSKGQASVEFKLPDNLTSWRITYHAVTDDLLASSGTSQLPVRLPFFINMNVNPTYRVGDAPVVVVRSYGSQLKPAQTVKYQITLTNPQGKNLIQTGTGSAFTSFDYTLPALQPGNYTIKIAAKSGSYQDTLVQSFNATSSVIRRHMVEQQILRADSKLQGSGLEPTTLVFSDYEKNQYLSALWELSWLYGSRVEHRIASEEAEKLLQHHFPETKMAVDLTSQSSLLNYQQVDGGISLLPYATSDLGISARIASSAPDAFDRRALKGYFYRLLDTDKGADQSLIWLGLASLDEPVLLSVKEALKQNNLAPAQRINLSLALLEMGDGAYAAEVYEELMKKYSQDLGNSLRINMGKDQDEIIAATTQMALLAARLNQPPMHQLLAYLLQNPGEDIVNSLELLQIQKYGLQYMDTNPVSFTYQLNGKTVSKTLKNNETFKLTVLPADLSKLKFSQIKGKVGMIVYYSAPALSTGGISDDMEIKRSYYVGNKSLLSLSRSALVRVELNTNAVNKAPGGSYEVIDVLPAGLAYLSRPYTPINEKSIYPDWPTEVNGGQLTFVVPKGQSKIVYYARVVAPGKYKAEAPLLQHCQNPQVFVRGVEQEMVIK